MRILGPVAESNALYRPPPPSEITIVSGFGLNSASRSFVPQNLGAQKGDLIVWIYAYDNNVLPNDTMSVNGSFEVNTQFPNVSPYTNIDYQVTSSVVSDTSGPDVGRVAARMHAHTIVDPTHTIEMKVLGSEPSSDPVVAGLILRGQLPGSDQSYYRPLCFSPQVDHQLTGKKAAGSAWSSVFYPYPRIPDLTITNPPSADAIAKNYNGVRLALNFVATLSTPGSSLQPPAGWTKIADKTSLVNSGVAWEGIVTVAAAYKFLPLDGDTSWSDQTWAANVVGNNLSFVKAVELAVAGPWSRDDE